MRSGEFIQEMFDFEVAAPNYARMGELAYTLAILGKKVASEDATLTDYQALNRAKAEIGEL